jgi:hypothetical protein
VVPCTRSKLCTYLISSGPCCTCCLQTHYDEITVIVASMGFFSLNLVLPLLLYNSAMRPPFLLRWANAAMAAVWTTVMVSDCRRGLTIAPCMQSHWCCMPLLGHCSRMHSVTVRAGQASSSIR